MPATQTAIDHVAIVAAAAESKQGDDIVALDVSGPIAIVDAFVIITGRN